MTPGGEFLALFLHLFSRSGITSEKKQESTLAFMANTAGAGEVPATRRSGGGGHSVTRCRSGWAHAEVRAGTQLLHTTSATCGLVTERVVGRDRTHSIPRN